MHTGVHTEDFQVKVYIPNACSVGEKQPNVIKINQSNGHKDILRNISGLHPRGVGWGQALANTYPTSIPKSYSIVT